MRTGNLTTPWRASRSPSFTSGSAAVGFVERLVQGVDVGFVVVNVERRSSRRSDPETPHQGLGTVVAGPHAHAGFIEHLRDVVGMDAVVAEGDHAPARRRLRRPEDLEF